MKTPSLILCFLLISLVNGFSQVAINQDGAPPNSSAILDLSSTTKGFLAPRLTTAQRIALGPSAIDGLLVYDSDLHAFFSFKSGSSNAWEQELTSTSGWFLTGNSGTSAAANFLGTTDNQDLVFKVNNVNAGRLSSTATTLFGYQAGDVNTAGHNTFIGWSAGKANTTGDDNIALGQQALMLNTTGAKNVAIGSLALGNNIKGQYNTSIGYKALTANTTAGSNVAIGYNALFTQSYDYSGNSYSTYNTAIGNEALYSNQPVGSLTSGSNNTATGYHSLYANTTGYQNVANGASALADNTTGPENSAFGFKALQHNTAAGYNVAVGNYALQAQSFTNGGSLYVAGNTAIGFNALQMNQPTSAANGIQNTAVGFNALEYNSTGYNNSAFGNSALLWNNSGYDNTAVGTGAFSSIGPAYSNSTALGANAQISASNQVKLGDNNVTSLVCTGASAATTTNGPNVYIDNNGQFFRSTTGGSSNISTTATGGIAILLTNFSGTALLKGTVVQAGSADLSFVDAAANSEYPIGVLAADCASNAQGWVVVSGIAEVLLKDGTSSNAGYWAGVSDVAGRAYMTTSGAPGTNHDKEIGHCLQTVSSGTDVTAKAVLHFR